MNACKISASSLFPLICFPHSVKTLQSINFLMLNNRSLLVLKKIIGSVRTYDLLLPASIKELKIFLHKT